MKQKSIALAALAALALGASTAASAASFYTNEASFDTAATGLGALTTQSFETISGSTSTSLSFGGVSFSCVGHTFCPGFFGQSTLYSTDGTHSVYGATPDSMVFTFASKITEFAIDLIGLGDVGATNFKITLSDGASQTVFSNLSQRDGVVDFVGAIDTAGFTSVTFTGSQANDGVFYDRLQYGGHAITAAVPEPSTYALMFAGLGAVGFIARRRKA